MVDTYSDSGGKSGNITPEGIRRRLAWFGIPLLLFVSVAAPLPADEREDDPPVNIPWGPYLQNLTPTGVTFMWTANTPNEGVVEYGETNDNLDRRVPAKAVLPDENCRQEATLRGLQPSKIYYYRVKSMPTDGREPVSSELGSFATPDPEATAFSFGVIADTHQSMHAPALASRLYDEQPHFILHAGDYNKTMGGLLQPYSDVLRRIPIYFARGNHDHRHEQWVSMPGPGSDRFYSFRWGNALLIAVDTEDRKGNGLKADGEQYQWLERELAKSKDTWRFVFQHIPVYSAYRGGMESSLDELRGLFEKYAVDVVFQGHMHHYDRSFPLRDQKPVSRAEGGVTYVTASGACGGYEKFPHPHRLWFIAKQWRGAPFYGTCAVNGRQATIQFQTADGLLFDTLELTAR